MNSTKERVKIIHKVVTLTDNKYIRKSEMLIFLEISSHRAWSKFKQDCRFQIIKGNKKMEYALRSDWEKYLDSFFLKETG